MGRPRKKNKHLLPRLQMKAGRYYYTPYIDGKVQWKPLGGDYGKALTEWAKLEATELQSVTLFDDLAREFQLTKVPKWKESTRKLFPFWLANLQKVFGGVEIAEIQASHVYGYVDKRRLEGKENAGLRERSVLGSMLEFARERGWLAINPARGTTIARAPKRSRLLSDAEYAAIYKAANPEVKAAMRLAYVTGIRIGDILALSRSNIETLGLAVTQAKTGTKALYKWTPELRAAVAQAKGLRKLFNAKTLICRRDGKPYTYYGFRAMWDRACKKAGVEDANFHDIKGMAATEAKRQGRNVREFTVHTSEKMAADYVKGKAGDTVIPLQIRSKTLRKALNTGAEKITKTH